MYETMTSFTKPLHIEPVFFGISLMMMCSYLGLKIAFLTQVGFYNPPRFNGMVKEFPSSNSFGMPIPYLLLISFVIATIIQVVIPMFFVISPRDYSMAYQATIALSIFFVSMVYEFGYWFFSLANRADAGYICERHGVLPNRTSCFSPASLRAQEFLF